MAAPRITAAPGVTLVKVTKQQNAGNNPGIVITPNAPKVGSLIVAVVMGSQLLSPDTTSPWKFLASPNRNEEYFAIIYKPWTANDAATQQIGLTSAGLNSNAILIYEFADAALVNAIQQFSFVINQSASTTPSIIPNEPGTMPVVAFGSTVFTANPSSVASPFIYDGDTTQSSFGANSYVSGAHTPHVANTSAPISGTFTAGTGVTAPYFTVTFLVRSATPGSVSDLVRQDSQTRLAVLQVYRGGNWVTIPFESIKGTLGKGKAGKLDIAIPEIKGEPQRNQVFEGERMRLYRGVYGASLVRCFTGYVDNREPTDSVSGVSRKIVVTDVVKELNDAIMLDGAVYDGMTPAQAAVDLLGRAIASQQYKPQDDAGNFLTDLTNANLPNGNQICYFPDLRNDDGSLFVLPQGTIASFTAQGNASPTLQIPAASGGYNYVAFEFPKKHLIASTTAITGFTRATGSVFPPAPGSYFLDSYNGFAYFNASDGNRIASFTSSYYDGPLFNYDQGKKVGDALSELFDRAGNRWKPDGFGKLTSQYVDAVIAPKKILNKGSYVDAGVSINRERRNVIVCLGWDGVCGGLLVSKCVLTEDINNQPPFGLGKRAYIVVQDKTWATQYAVNVAAYYAAMQVGRRGKIASVTVLDDPSIQVDDAFAFESTVTEIGTGDFFYVEQTTFDLSVTGSQVKATNNLSGTLLPSRGLIYLGPASAISKYGNVDYSNDVTPIMTCQLQDHISHSQIGGSYFSTFSLSRGLDLVYQTGSLSVVESIDVYGSDGSHHVYENNISRAAGTVFSLPLPITGTTAGDISLIAGVLYVFKFYARDSNGNIGIFRDCATAAV